MSAVVKTNRAGHKPSPATAVLVALGFIVVVFFLVTYGQQLLMEHGLKEKAAAQRVANAALRDDNIRLQASLQYYQSDKYIEQRAREGLNLRRPEEEVIIPIKVAPDASAGKPPVVETPVAANPAQQSAGSNAPNWERWFNLFNPNE
jgi:cell division protein FtsB